MSTTNKSKLYFRGTRRPEVFPIGEDDRLLDETDKPDGTRPQTQLSTTVRVGMGSKADSTFIQGDNAIRRLTPKECERLQGFPDDWTAGVSDTQRYKCCGNAVTVNVIKEIMKRLTHK